MLQPRGWHQATVVLTGKEIKNILTGKKTRERRYKKKTAYSQKFISLT